MDHQQSYSTATMIFQLPPEALASILSLVNVDCIIHLWKTGSVHLRNLIDNAPLRTLELQDACIYSRCHWPVLAGRWKRAFCSLVLRTDSALLDPPPIIRDHILQLSPNLTTLVLCTPSAEQILTETRETELSDLLRLYRSSSGFTPDVYPRMINLASIFPELTTLEVAGAERTMQNCDLFALPPKLTSLTWSLNNRFTDECFQHLPHSLLSLEMASGVQENSSVFALPPNLTSFTWNCCNTVCVEKMESRLKKLPASLTNLVITWVRVPHYSVDLLLPSLPTGLKSIYLLDEFLQDPISSPFPPQLETLNLKMRPSYSPSKLPLILPSNLTELFLKFEERMIMDDDFVGLPPMLTKLTLMGKSKMTEKGVSLLPPSLFTYKHFQLGHGGPTCKAIWPPGLRQLHLSQDANSDDSVLTLPSTLQSISVRSISEEDLQYIPSSLQTLEITASVSSIWPEKLPLLTSLEIQHCHILTSEDISHLPRTLTRFGVSQMDTATSSLLRFRDCDWPPFLTHLYLDFYCPRAGTSLTVEDMKMLPRHLTELVLPKVEMMDVEAFENLPPGLRHLDLLSVSTINGKHLNMLPRGLEVLLMHNLEGVTDEHVALLPRSITALLFGHGYDMLTADCRPYLPPNLKRWTLPQELNLLPRQPRSKKKQSNCSVS